MPKPNPSENRDEFLERCIPQVIEEGNESDQAVAICVGHWNERNKRYAKWKAFDQRRWGYLSYGINLITKALEQQAQPYFGLQDLSERPQLDPKPIQRAYRQLYSRVIRNFGNDMIDSLKSHPKVTIQKDIADWDSIISNWLDVNTANLIYGVTETTQRGIERLLERALSEGLSVEQFTDLLKDNYYLSRRRGRVIARTEIIRASNFGNHLGAKNAGIPLEKEWLSTQDSRTRRIPEDSTDHFTIDGQKRQLDQPFTVPNLKKGDEFLQFPGDPNASPENSIMCRCVVSYNPI